MPDELLTAREVAAVYGVSTRTVQRVAKRHRWRALKVGRIVYYDARDVAATPMT